MTALIDLRSDTVTRPTDAMRAAMAAAEVGDDVYLEDPTVNRLQEEAAAAVGMEAALFVPSGSMGNLLAVKVHTQPGQEILIQEQGHILQFEMGHLAWFSGLTPRTMAGRRGLVTPEEVAAGLHVDVPYYRQRTGLLAVENSHTAGGGSIYPVEQLHAVCRAARERGVPVHLDGARIFNAAVALGVPARELCREADSVMFCFSKGLSAPVGSVVCGRREFIEEARRVRRVVGGGMRQAGVLAAAALVALRTMVERLAEDHASARRLADGAAEIPALRVDREGVQTNIVVFGHREGAAGCTRVVQGLRERGVLASQLAADNVRLVTHRHIGSAEVERALAALREVA